MAVSFSKITEVFGAAVGGVDIAAGVSETAMRDIVDLFNEYSILIFHDQKINDEQQIRFSRLFSEIGNFGGLEKPWCRMPVVGRRLPISQTLSPTPSALSRRQTSAWS